MGRVFTGMVCSMLAVASVAACAKNPPEIGSEKYAAPSQGVAPAADKVESVAPGFDGRPEDVEPAMEPREDLTLTALVLISLKNSSSARLAWHKARAAAAAWGESRSEYYPTVAGQIEIAEGRVNTPINPGGRSYLAAGATLKYLLLDFGGREARVEAARQGLIAANWSHDQTLQDILRDVPQAYYTYLGDRALIDAAEKNLADATTTLNATEARRTAGVATVADVLQAKSSASQARADLAARRGDAKISKGDLATTVGWNADAAFDVAREPGRPPVADMVAGIERLVREARANRPELGAAQAAVREMEARVKEARTLPFPKLGGSGTAQYQYFSGRDTTALYGSLQLQIPIFAGFSMENALKRARARYEAAKAQLTLTEQRVIKEVWDAYHRLKSVAEQFRAYQALHKSARESYRVSLARYKEGAADITELLNAQNTLAQARAELIDARMNLYRTYAELMHAVGRKYGRNA